MPPEVRGWLTAFVEMVTTVQTQICLSDMMLPGNPLIYVNHTWCKTTGYSREEVLGRNCRLLQGQDTQPAAVQEMVDALRAGVDACVCITNYRKDGEKFDNLVVLRPVLDSNGVCRFCVSAQVRLGPEASLGARLRLLADILKYMPNIITYCSSSMTTSTAASMPKTSDHAGENGEGAAKLSWGKRIMRVLCRYFEKGSISNDSLRASISLLAEASHAEMPSSLISILKSVGLVEQTPISFVLYCLFQVACMRSVHTLRKSLTKTLLNSALLESHCWMSRHRRIERLRSQTIGTNVAFSRCARR